jgi:predicted CXXCH cytochrome family protein
MRAFFILGRRRFMKGFLIALGAISIIFFAMGEGFGGEDAQYVGSEKCGTCHVTEHKVWKTTNHAKMIKDVTKDPSAIVAHQEHKTGPLSFESIKYTVGGNQWKQRYMREDFSFATIQWNVKTKEYTPWNISGSHSWYRDCGGCHSTGFKRTSDMEPIDSPQKYAKAKFSGTYAELNIGCEACHGPGSNHVNAPSKNNIVNPAKLTQQLSISVCAQCHTVFDKPKDADTGKPRKTGFYWWPNGFKPGEDIEKYIGKTFIPFAPTGQTGTYYWADGTSRDHHQNYQDMLRSKHYKAGLTCNDCHSVHSEKSKESLTKMDARDNSLCYTCHSDKKAKLVEHTKHSQDSIGSKCIECHMPKVIKNAVQYDERAHTFEFISPEKGIKYNMPNSCNTCHKDKSPEWAVSVMKGWEK